jgi:DNA-binding FadR family transcriptional regulator
MGNIFKKPARTTLAQKARENNRNAITGGKLKTGEKLVEAKLYEQMGISRFSIREALRALEEIGLMISKPYKGTYVSQISENNALPYQAKINNKQIRLIAFTLFALMIYVMNKNRIQLVLLVRYLYFL